jgi:hypothetical protein
MCGPPASSRRRIWLVLWLWTALWGLLRSYRGGYSWHYFDLGAGLLIHPSRSGGGVHIYAQHPELQIGPLAFLAAAPLRAFGPMGGRVLASVLLTALGPAVVWMLVRMRDRHVVHTSDVLSLSTGLLLLPVWCEVATHYAHIDDALALIFGLAAVDAVLRRRPLLAGALIAAGIDSKPWAAGFLVVMFTLRREDRNRSLAMAAAGVGIAWLPFVFGDARTLSLGRFTIANMDNSALRALGVHALNTPWWDRPAQLALGVCVAVVAARRGRWSVVLLAVVVARLLLDPATYPYYTSGLLVCTAVVDLLQVQRAFPMWTAAGALWYVVDRLGVLIMPAAWLGDIRAAYCLTILVMVCVLPRSQSSSDFGAIPDEAAVSPVPRVRAGGAHRRVAVDGRLANGGKLPCLQAGRVGLAKDVPRELDTSSCDSLLAAPNPGARRTCRVSE